VGLPPSPVEFSSLRHSHQLSGSWLLGARRHSCLFQPFPACLFTVQGGIPLPTSSVLRVLHPLCHMSLLFLLFSFSFFPGRGQSVQGAMLIWPRVVCGSTAYCLAHLVCVFPSHLGMGVWSPRGPCWFLCLTVHKLLNHFCY
jgi:hypothetical protein